jgi:hypothetical protein
LRQRIIALAAAYAIVLSSLIASFGVARAAAETAGVAGFPLCHALAAAPTSPASAPGQTDTTCTNSCCIGCLMLLAAVPSPPSSAAPILRSIDQAFAPTAVAVPIGGAKTKSHRSRAPPQIV